MQPSSLVVCLVLVLDALPLILLASLLLLSLSSCGVDEGSRIAKWLLVSRSR